MKKKIAYTDEPIIGRRSLDFLPSPDELIKAPTHVRITINLSEESLEFFRELAQKHDTKYQQLIRNLLDAYVQRNKQHK